MLGLAVLALVFATAQAPAPPPTSSAPVVVRDATGASATLTANGLFVRDAAGRTRTFVGLDNGKPSMDLRDAAGGLRSSMFLVDDVPYMRQYDAKGTTRSQLRLDSTSDGEFNLYDQNAKLRLGLFRTTGGDPQIGLYGSDEKLRAYFATDDTSPYLVMRDASGTNRIYVGGYTDGSIGMNVRDSSNTIVWKAP